MSSPAPPHTPLKETSNTTPISKKRSRQLQKSESKENQPPVESPTKRMRKFSTLVYEEISCNSSPEADLKERVLEPFVLATKKGLCVYKSDDTAGNTRGMGVLNEIQESKRERIKMKNEIAESKKDVRDLKIGMESLGLTSQRSVDVTIRMFANLKKVKQNVGTAVAFGPLHRSHVKEGNVAAHIPNLRDTLYSFEKKDIGDTYAIEFNETFGCSLTTAFKLRDLPSWVELVSMRADLVVNNTWTKGPVEQSFCERIDAATKHLDSHDLDKMKHALSEAGDPKIRNAIAALKLQIQAHKAQVCGGDDIVF